MFSCPISPAVDDVLITAAGLEHRRDAVLEHVEHAARVDRRYPFPVLDVHLVQRLLSTLDARVVEDDVDPAVVADGHRDRALDRRCIRRVDGHGQAGGQRRRHGLGTGRVDVGDDDTGALVGEPPRGRLAEAGRAAGREQDGVRESHDRNSSAGVRATM